VYPVNPAKDSAFAAKPDMSFLKKWLDHLLKNLPISADNPVYKPSYTVRKQSVSS
jgi:hypothetical protein